MTPARAEGGTSYRLICIAHACPFTASSSSRRCCLCPCTARQAPRHQKRAYHAAPDTTLQPAVSFLTDSSARRLCVPGPAKRRGGAVLFTGVGRASEAPLQSRLRKGKRETMTYAQALQCTPVSSGCMHCVLTYWGVGRLGWRVGLLGRAGIGSQAFESDQYATRAGWAGPEPAQKATAGCG